MPKSICLLVATIFLFIGCFGGFTSLQLAQSKIKTATSTAVELSILATKSDYCKAHPSDQGCLRAQEIMTNPEAALGKR